MVAFFSYLFAPVFSVSPLDWISLNRTVGGRLLKRDPLPGTMLFKLQRLSCTTEYFRLRYCTVVLWGSRLVDLTVIVRAKSLSVLIPV
jgi:hypothetical protein